ncbi:HAD-IA family hydrolase [Actinoplanes sp. KI2]|uniref:HAD family hydrolase n=1 Tax=Actinoplanes sp. KI2 TaxID=2983315 RepID=UPI0021D5EC57|nr:HAD-IA family hydrolase [Actinoplanes sp. KI2]MCU7725096.1 HAD-IA family hydrolase [Actinoplanes sp. KI2]
MSLGKAGARRPALLIDVGGVLMADCLTAAAAAWGDRLGIAPHAFLAALFAGNDDQILVGRVGEAAWWRTIADRLHLDERQAAAIRADLRARQTWNSALLTGLRRIHGRATITIVSNAWPDIRAGLAEAGVLDLADTVVLSCEVGYAKPDPRIYAIALHSVRADPADALFIDDTLEHVDAATALGMSGHLHSHTGQTLTRIERFVESAPLPHLGYDH